MLHNVQLDLSESRYDPRMQLLHVLGPVQPKHVVVSKFTRQFLQLLSKESVYMFCPTQGFIPNPFLNPTIPAMVAIIARITMQMISNDLFTVLS